MSKVRLTDILDLPVDERILLVEDIWDSIAELPEAVALSEGQREELDRRLAEYHRAPDIGSPWEEIKARVRRG